MLDYKQLDKVYELTDKYADLVGKHVSVSLKLGLHPNSCEFKLTIDHAEGDWDCFTFECIDSLTERLESLIKHVTPKPKFQIGDTIWFLDCHKEIDSMIIEEIEYLNLDKKYRFYKKGWYVYEPVAYGSKRELIEAQIKKWRELLTEEVLCNDR